VGYKPAILPLDMRPDIVAAFCTISDAIFNDDFDLGMLQFCVAKHFPQKGAAKELEGDSR
jgi:hypothetical protein